MSVSAEAMRPLVGEPVVLAEVAVGAGDNEVAGIVGAAPAERYDVIDVVLLDALAAPVAATALASELSDDVGASVRARRSDPHGRAPLDLCPRLLRVGQAPLAVLGIVLIGVPDVAGAAVPPMSLRVFATALTRSFVALFSVALHFRAFLRETSFEVLLPVVAPVGGDAGLAPRSEPQSIALRRVEVLASRREFLATLRAGLRFHELNIPLGGAG